MGITKGCKQLIADARDRIRTLTLDEAKARLNDPNVTFIDIREAHERENDGAIPSAFHAPRGMLEFLVDPASPAHNDVFSSGNEFVLYCASSDHRAWPRPRFKTWASAPSHISKAASKHGSKPACLSNRSKAASNAASGRMRTRYFGKKATRPSAKETHSTSMP